MLCHYKRVTDAHFQIYMTKYGCSRKATKEVELYWQVTQKP